MNGIETKFWATNPKNIPNQRKHLELKIKAVTTEDLLRAAKQEEKNRFLTESKKTFGFVV
ncbi:hypothetical protein RDn1_111 [Candidatus Termititenax dinenymphae]|uniref:Uncharacterized protein n=1 Tax=Candidatus Termititenax dinenymphae TaxID=2218523 RepID=A0A388TK57_9BACT|nr:hypothetical protein RDn1_111 [Candidatus Termititenax dinenymphae]